jgi:PEP-CTERM motif
MEGRHKMAAATRMNGRIVVAAITALLLKTSANADVFPEGYTFTYHFDTLQLVQSFGVLPGNYLFVGIGTPPLTSTISWEIFDGLPSGAPVAAGTWWGYDATSAGIPVPTWQDAEGSFRISVLSGSQEIDHFSIYVVHEYLGGNIFSVYELTVLPSPVPEPGTSSLILIGLSGVALWALRHKGQRPAA